MMMLRRGKYSPGQVDGQWTNQMIEEFNRWAASQGSKLRRVRDINVGDWEYPGRSPYSRYLSQGVHTIVDTARLRACATPELRVFVAHALLRAASRLVSTPPKLHIYVAHPSAAA